MTLNCGTCKGKTSCTREKCSRAEVLSKFPMCRAAKEINKVKEYYKGRCLKCGTRFWGIDYNR